MNNERIEPTILIDELKKVLSDENYEYAAAVVTYSEAKSLEFNYTGMAEFRDALTHIKRAIYSEDKKIVSAELTSAFEHIRRAAVESMQEYVEVRYAEIRRRIYLSNLKSILARYKKPNLGDIVNSEQVIKANIAYGRAAKPRKAWQEAIGFFKIAEDELDKLDKIVPTQDELNYRMLETTEIIMFLIIGLIIGHYLI